MAVGAPLGLNNPRVSRIWRFRHHSAIIREIPPRSVRRSSGTCVGAPLRRHLKRELTLAFANRLTAGAPPLSHGPLHFLGRRGVRSIDLVNHLAQAVKTARTGGQGFWSAENAGANKESKIPTIAPLSDLVMFPKSNRRLVQYFLDQPDHGLVGFNTWVRADGKDRDDRLMLPNRGLGSLHGIYSITGDNVEPTVLPVRSYLPARPGLAACSPRLWRQNDSAPDGRAREHRQRSVEELL
jgi:hypothetical protein